MCGKYPCACVMPERYFNLLLAAQTQPQEKGKSLILCLCLHQGHFHGEITFVLTIVLAILLYDTYTKSFVCKVAKRISNTTLHYYIP